MEICSLKNMDSTGIKKNKQKKTWQVIKTEFTLFVILQDGGRVNISI